MRSPLHAKRIDMEKLLLNVAHSSVWIVATISLILAAYLVGVGIQGRLFA